MAAERLKLLELKRICAGKLNDLGPDLDFPVKGQRKTNLTMHNGQSCGSKENAFGYENQMVIKSELN